MNEIVRVYSMPDADLMMFASNLVQTMTRDSAEFADYAVDAAAISAFAALGNQFEEFPPDTFYSADVSIAVEDKDAIRETLINETRKITNRALVKWGEDSARYAKFGVKGISKMTDKELLATTRLVALTAENLLSQLITEGLTQDMIDDYALLSQSFESKLNALANAIEIRDTKKTERIILGNKLYSFVAKYCTLGKTIWEKVNESKFNDYIIYEKSPGGLSAPKNFRFFRGSRVFAWDLVPNATSYAMEMSYNQTDWEQVFYEEWNETEFDVPEGWSYYRVRAHNGGGFGEYCDVLAIEYYRMLPTPQNFRLELVESTPKKARCVCDVVPTAESYMTYVSVVNIGASPGDWTGANSDVIPEVYNPLVAGKRNYFQMQAQNEGQSSLKTEALYLDVPIS